MAPLLCVAIGYSESICQKPLYIVPRFSSKGMQCMLEVYTVLYYYIYIHTSSANILYIILSSRHVYRYIFSWNLIPFFSSFKIFTIRIFIVAVIWCNEGFKQKNIFMQSSIIIYIYIPRNDLIGCIQASLSHSLHGHADYIILYS